LRRTRWTGRLALLVAGLAIGCVAAEFAFRVARPDDAVDLLYNAPDNAPDGLYTTDSTVYAIPTPGFRGVQQSLGYKVDLRINQHGLRGPEVGEKSTLRYLAIGDSFTMAAQVAEADTFVVRAAGDLNVEILNAGVDGYGTFQALERYKQLDETLDLDGVILTFFVGNDVHDNVRWDRVQQDARRVQPGQPLRRRPVGAVHGFFYKRSALYAAIQMQLRRRAMAKPTAPERHRWTSELMLFTQDGGGILGAQMPQSAKALREFAAETARRGDSFLVAIAPPAFQIETERMDATFSLIGLDPNRARVDAVSNAVRDSLQRSGIRHCDLVDPLRRAHRAGGEMYLQYDGHWSPKGHAVVANALVKCMASAP